MPSQHPSSLFRGQRPAFPWVTPILSSLITWLSHGGPHLPLREKESLLSEPPVRGAGTGFRDGHGDPGWCGESQPWPSPWEEKLSFWKDAKLQDVNLKLLASHRSQPTGRQRGETRRALHAIL